MLDQVRPYALLLARAGIGVVFLVHGLQKFVTMGLAQTFAGLARVAAPILATTAFQRLGHGWPFYLAGVFVALVGIMAFQVEVHPRIARPAAERAEA